MTRNLFLDDSIIEQLNGVVRMYGQPEKEPANPVFTGGEQSNVGEYASISFDEETKRYRLWYSNGGLCYAESNDGVNFKIPVLGIISGAAPNTVFTGRDGIVIGGNVLDDGYDPEPQRRYKCLWTGKDEGDWGVEGAFSPDGLHWRLIDKTPLIPVKSDTFNNCLFDPELGKYVAFARPGYIFRMVARLESKDFIEWSEPQLVFEPKPDYSYQIEYYSMPTFLYEGYYIGLLMVYHTDENDMNSAKMYGLRQTTQLAFSRNGICWHHVQPGKEFIQCGKSEDDFDYRFVHCCSTPIITDDRIVFYYVGRSFRHGPLPKKYKSGLGVARLRRDGFVRLELKPGREKGHMLTKVAYRHWIVGRGLYVNADCSKGRLCCELRDCDNKPISGYTLNDSLPVTTDSTQHRIRWRGHDLISGNPDISAVTMRDLRLYFEFKGKTRLFSFYFL